MVLAGLLVLGLRAWRWPVFFRLGVRQIPRRPQQTALIAAGLMLSTALITASLNTGDTLSHSIRGAAVAELGQLDEVITYSGPASPGGGPGGSFFSDAVAERLRQRIGADARLRDLVAGMTPVISLDCTVVDVTTRQTSYAIVRGLPPDYPTVFGGLTDASGGGLSLERLQPGEVVLNASAGAALVAGIGDELSCVMAGVPHRWRVAGIADSHGLGAGVIAYLYTPLRNFQASLRLAGVDDTGAPINQIWIANRGDSISSVRLTDPVVAALRPLLIDTAALDDVRTALNRADVRAALAVRRGALPERTQRAIDELLAVLDGRPPPDQSRAARSVDPPGRGGQGGQGGQETGGGPPGPPDQAGAGSGQASPADRLQQLLRNGQLRSVLVASARDTADRQLVVGLPSAMQRAISFQVSPVKRQVLDIADRAGSVITTIFLLFALLSIGAGLLLVFLIFSLLAASRRSELGVARALGTERGHLVAMFTFEGVAYSLLALLLGVPAGMGIARLLVVLLIWAVRNGTAGFTGTPERVAETVTWYLEPRSAVLAGSLGLLLTLTTVAISAWRVSRVTIVTAIRDLPDPPPLGRRFFRSWLFLLGPVGAGLVALGLWRGQAIPFSAGVSGLILTAGVVARTLSTGRLGRERAARLGALIAGGGLAVYWALPFDVQQRIGLPRLEGGIEVFALAGVLMVVGACWALSANGSVLLGAVTALLGALARPAPAFRLAAAHMLLSPFRTGLTTAMFALVVFMLTVMQVITTASLRFHGDPVVTYGGWDIQARTAVAPTAQVGSSPLGAAPADGTTGGSGAPGGTGGPGLGAASAAGSGSGSSPAATGSGSGAAAPFNPETAAALTRTAVDIPELRPVIAAAGSRTSALFALVQLSAPAPAWSGYAVSAVDESFARANLVPLQTRARGFATDRAVWEAVAQGTQYAVVDGNSLPSPQLRGRPNVATFSYLLQGVTDQQAVMEPVPVWIGNPTGGAAARKVLIAGVIDRRASAAFRGLHVSGALFRSLGSPVRPPAVEYYFRVRPGVAVNDARAVLGAAFYDQGLQTTSVPDRFQNENGPLLLASLMLQLFVGLGLFVGIAALGVVSSRAALERRQEIGVLRAIGWSRGLVAASVLLESGLVVVAGCGIGAGLGLVLCRNVFAVQFFDRFQQGMRMVVPWEQLALTAGLTCLAALLATWLPARQASRIPPMAALRSE